jgi:hypothetical protein
MVAVLAGRLGDGGVGEGDLPGGDALVLADQVTYALMAIAEAVLRDCAARGA